MVDLLEILIIYNAKLMVIYPRMKKILGKIIIRNRSFFCQCRNSFNFLYEVFVTPIFEIGDCLAQVLDFEL